MNSSTARQERRAATLDDPTFERFRSPRARAALVGALAGVMVLEAATLLTVTLVPTAVSVVALVLLVVALVMALGTLKASTRGIEELSTDVLDERQAQVRGLVFARSYRVLTAVMAVTSAAFLAAAVDWWDAPPQALAAVAVIALQLVITIPTIVTALHPKAG